MSLGKTFLQESGIETELNSFLEYLIRKFSLNRNDVFYAMREYKSDEIRGYKNEAPPPSQPQTMKVKGVTVNSDGTELPSNPVPRARGSSNHSSHEMFSGPVKGADGKVHSSVETAHKFPKPPTLNKSTGPSEVTFSRKGERYTVKCNNGFLERMANPQLSALFGKKSLGDEEYNYLKNFFRTHNIGFTDVAPPEAPKVEKLTSINDIINKVQHEIEEDEKLPSTLVAPTLPPKTSSSEGGTQKLKLIKVGTNLAWDKATGYVFRLTKNIDDKTSAIAFATRASKEGENQPLTEANIKDLEKRGLKYDKSLSS